MIVQQDPDCLPAEPMTSYRNVEFTESVAGYIQQSSAVNKLILPIQGVSKIAHANYLAPTLMMMTKEGQTESILYLESKCSYCSSQQASRK